MIGFLLDEEGLTFTEELVLDDGAMYRGQIRRSGERHGYGI